MGKGLISVIMPVYNGQQYLRDAIDSIINQTYDKFELIILNDCSTDNTESIIKSYDDSRIIYIKNDTNLGVAQSLNKCLKLAKGEYIARMDADDIALPDRFDKQINFLNKHSDFGICGSNVYTIDSYGNVLGCINYSEYDNEINVNLLFKQVFCHPSVMIRASVLKDNCLMYDFLYEKAEDYKLWYDILKITKGYNIQHRLLKYRVHNNQVTITAKPDQRRSGLKIRNMIFDDLCIDEKYRLLYINLSYGQRKYSMTEYKQVKQFFNEFMKSNVTYDKKVLKNTLSNINLEIFIHSKVLNYKCIKISEYFKILYIFLINKIKKIHGECNG